MSNAPALFAHFRAHLLPSLAWHADALGRHKGDLGRLGIIGGCDNYHGAPFYAAMAALRAGGELATVFCQGHSASVAIKALSPELMVLPALPAPAADRDDNADAESETDAVSAALSAVRQQRSIAASARSIGAMLPRLRSFAIGSGLGRDPLAHAAVAAVLDQIRAQDMPVVLDGDAIHLVCSQARVIAGNRRAVLTPNAAEFRRLYEATFGAQDRVDWVAVTEAMTALLLAAAPPPSALPHDDLDSVRLSPDLAWVRPAVRLARELGVVIVQKGPVDLITDGQCGS